MRHLAHDPLYERFFNPTRQALVTQAERYAAQGRDFVVPVETQPRRAVQVHPETDDELPGYRVAEATVEQLRFQSFQVAVDDRSAAATIEDPIRLAATLARRCAAEADRLLLDPLPVTARRDPLRMATFYTFYATENTVLAQTALNGGTTIRLQAPGRLVVQFPGTADATTVAGIATERAYDAYAQGTGNALGAYTTGVTIGTNANIATTITYDYLGDARYGVTATQAADRLTTYWRHLASTGGTGGAYQDTYHETPEQVAARKAREAKVAVVRERADRLFLSQLSPDQRQTWLASKYFDVVAPSGRRYRVKGPATHNNVFLVDAVGRELRRYCAYANDPGGMLPAGDQWFSQLLTLRYNEREFLRAANTWDLLRGVFVGQGADAELADAALEIAAA